MSKCYFDCFLRVSEYGFMFRDGYYNGLEGYYFDCVVRFSKYGFMFLDKKVYNYILEKYFLLLVLYEFEDYEMMYL